MLMKKPVHRPCVFVRSARVCDAGGSAVEVLQGDSYRRKGLADRRSWASRSSSDTREAFFGVSVPIEVLGYVRCSRCEGGGGEWGVVCPLCHGYVMGVTHTVKLEIP